MPNQPKTPTRTIRVPQEEWEWWAAIAEERGVSLTAFIRESVNNRAYRVERQARNSQ